MARWSARLARDVPGAVAVVLKGSCARGVLGPHSDVDFDVIVADGREPEYLAWLGDAAGRLIHVSAAVRDVSSWLAEEDEPQQWALGFTSAEATRLLWALDEEWRARIDRDCLAHPSGIPELEDFIESFGKMANARVRGDELALRGAAQQLAWLCPGVLLPFNEPVRVGTAHEALAAAIELTVAPPGYSEDMLTCLGLSGLAASTEDVFQAGRRLAQGTIAVCATEPAELAGMIPQDFFDSLVDGRLAQYVAQLGA